jgi:hypothetical protein
VLGCCCCLSPIACEGTDSRKLLPLWLKCCVSSCFVLCLLQSPDPEWEQAVEKGKAAGCVAYSKANNVPQVCAGRSALKAEHVSSYRVYMPGTADWRPSQQAFNAC